VRKGFIAAPLLGTILFLTAVIFVVNLNKEESSEVALIANEAYNNRVTSLLELYRSDLGSQFRENLARVIEDFLSSKCWDNLFRVSNQVVVGKTNYLDEKVLRYRACSYVNDVIHDVICSHVSSGVAEVCNEECLDNCGDTDACHKECCDYVEADAYGLPKWMREIADDFVFEGITFESANPDQFKVFLGDDPGYGDACRTLISTSLMDCKAFAEGELQCCKEIDSDRGGNPYQLVTEEKQFSDACLKDDVIDCSKGTFYVEINVEDKDVYPNLPRTKSSDGKGNEIRTGAISDSNFYLPINYPLYRYYDYAFGVYAELAKEVNPEEPENSNLCTIEGDGLDSDTEPDCGSVEHDGSSYSFGETKIEILGLLNGAVDRACNEYSTVKRKEDDDYWGKPVPKSPGSLSKESLALELCTISGECGATDDGWTDCETDLDESAIEGTIDLAKCGKDGDCYAVFQWSGAAKKMRFLDYEASVRTDPTQPNQFCFNVQPYYEPLESLNP